MDEIFSSKNNKLPELYIILGCDRKSTIEQITAEYRARVRALHPDKAGAASNNSFLQLQKAFNVLSDSQQRSVYDLWLDSPFLMDFEEFFKNSQAVKTSMHWTVPKETPQISLPLSESNVSPRVTKWKDNRYESDAVRKFLFMATDQ